MRVTYWLAPIVMGRALRASGDDLERLGLGQTGQHSHSLLPRCSHGAMPVEGSACGAGKPWG